MVAAVFAFVSGRNHHRYFVYAHSRMIGEELATATNSPHLVQLGPDLQNCLSQFLASPAGLSDVQLGDERSPLGDRSACSRIILSNAAGARLGIRLCQNEAPGKFHVLGFWAVTEPDGAANRSQPVELGTNSTSLPAGSGR